jgi:hypothetical protein
VINASEGSLCFKNFDKHSPVYACFLDAKQAFDRTWVSLLLVKSFKMGIDISLFKVILSFFENCYSCVKSQGYTSDWFPILQGARQGQCLSPFLYLIFIKRLMEEMDSSQHCFKLGTLKYGCPTFADDMVIISNTKRGLDTLMDRCYRNSHLDFRRQNHKRNG